MVSITLIEFPEEYFCWMEQVKEDLSQLKDECFSENKNIELVALYGSLTYDYIVEFNDNNKDWIRLVKRYFTFNYKHINEIVFTRNHNIMVDYMIRSINRSHDILLVKISEFQEFTSTYTIQDLQTREFWQIYTDLINSCHKRLYSYAKIVKQLYPLMLDECYNCIHIIEDRNMYDYEIIMQNNTELHTAFRNKYRELLTNALEYKFNDMARQIAQFMY